MRKVMMVVAAAAFVLATPAMAGGDQSSGRKAQERGMAEMPHCARPIGTIAIVEPDKQWWVNYNLGSPEAVLKVFVQQSGCFTLVNRGRSMQSRAMERAMADSGEMQRGSNMGKGQVRAADFFLEPDIVSSNDNSGGNNIGGAVGSLLGRRGGVFGAIAGGINIKKGEANVTLSVVNSRTTEESVVEGYYRKTDVGFSAATSASWWSGFSSVGGGGYQNTQIGQVIVLAYLDAYSKLVRQLGGA
ncbi:MAG: penicillin-binding protein activator LpoB [Sphingomonas sp.]|uniref:CsgG/HfaB family protein n=1 Tax=Sphingomonas sp. TaxID=28214 RepID=UPI00122343ED|nr:CsgG/HfaB family protein [Sphingomonas sp.]THD37785.1 MAG: penicillin-binding protein activator LpoB [Sphingomonas sp.]